MDDDIEKLLTWYRNFNATIVSDALDEHGIEGIITGLVPAHPDHTIVGAARPVQFEGAPSDIDQTNFPFALFEEFHSGDTFVMDSISPEISCWGEMASRLAAEAGVEGTIVNGGFRDYNSIRDGEYGVFGKTPTPRSGQPRLQVASIDDNIKIDGVTIARDDIVVADGTGISVVPRAEAQTVAQTAENLLEKELVLERKIENDATLKTLVQDYEGF